MRSYIKLYGPPVYKAIKTLESIAIDMPEVCIMDPIIQQTDELQREYMTETGGDIYSYLTGSASAAGYNVGDISAERCDKIIK